VLCLTYLFNITLTNSAGPTDIYIRQPVTQVKLKFCVVGIESDLLICINLLGSNNTDL